MIDKTVLRRYTTSIFVFLCLIAVVLTTSCGMFGYKPTQLETETGRLYSDIMDYAEDQANSAFGSLNGGFPTHTDGSSWVDDEQYAWARGYYPGILWLIYQSTGDTIAVKLADTWMQGLEPMKDSDGQFGMGMVFYPTYVTAYQITGNQNYRQVALDAADKLNARFTSAGYFPAFGATGDTVLGRRLSIESLMDLDLLYWASEATGNPEYARRATSHAAFTVARLIGPDGRILHVADFDPTTGAIYGDRTPELADNEKYAAKGYNASSVWAQGQAWAVYGMATAYRHEQNTIFLNAGLRAADYLIENLPEDGVPMWDFELPSGGERQKDSAAAAIAAAGLLKLAKLTPTPAQRSKYRDTAYKIISQLNNSYITETSRGVLDDGVWMRRGSQGVKGATSWGDYHFVEALLLLQDVGA